MCHDSFRLKQLTFTCLLAGFYALVLHAGQFEKGDQVILLRDEPLYFKENLNRQGTKGERFTVYAQDPASHKVYVSVIDSSGQQIALNIADDALALAQSGKMQAAASIGGTFAEPNTPFDAEIQSAATFLKDFYEKGHPKDRDQFETREEYEARLPKPVDSSKVIYLELSEQAGFSYDIDRQRLTVFGGQFRSPRYREYKLEGLAPLVIQHTIDEKGQYDASNAYGKSIKVTKAYTFDYVLHLNNAKLIPAQLKIPSKHSYEESQQLALSAAMPREQAKEAAAHLTLICGVRVLDYKHSVMECTMSGKPTMDDPYDIASFAYGADAELISVHIINKTTKQELVRWTR